jgi:ssDNA-binding Zn-finger/Zn-ribbon topoisomerase 1
MLPAGLVADYKLAQKDQTRARGLRLYERFIAGKVAEAVADAAEPSVSRPCPRCGSPLRLRVGKRGDFVACTGYPDCDYIGDPRAEPSPLKCHKCSGPMEEVEGKFGRYAQCVARDCRARVAVGHDRQRKQ